jgi:hypothetical protein
MGMRTMTSDPSVRAEASRLLEKITPGPWTQERPPVTEQMTRIVECPHCHARRVTSELAPHCERCEVFMLRLTATREQEQP